MISKELLDILQCPDNHTPLTMADEALIARLREKIAAGAIKNKGGEKFDRTLDGGLVREDGKLLYPIVDGLPILLVDEAIPLDQLEGSQT